MIFSSLIIFLKVKGVKIQQLDVACFSSFWIYEPLDAQNLLVEGLATRWMKINPINAKSSSPFWEVLCGNFLSNLGPTSILAEATQINTFNRENIKLLSP